MSTQDSRPDHPSPPVDQDMIDQAKPGHGIPSQDPDGAAQYPISAEEAEVESQSVLVGGGMVAGMATGAAIGVAVGGPIGVVVGASVGAVAGALGGAAAQFGLDDTNEEAVSLHVMDTGGSGRPVILIHGWPLSSESWGSQIDALKSEGFRVIAYDRRGFGQSDKSATDYSYDALADDLQHIITTKDLQDVSLVGFSMGGGEVARYIGRHGERHLRSVVFAAAVTPYLLHTPDNPEGPLPQAKAEAAKAKLAQNRDAFFNEFLQNFYSVDGHLKVTQNELHRALVLCQQSDPDAALACRDSFSYTDFRPDVEQITVPTLVIHGDSDAVVPFEGSGQRLHRMVAHSQLQLIPQAPHGLNVSHADQFNRALISFLKDSA